MMSTLLAGRCGLITGIANSRSIAWAIARAASAQGARLILTYQNDRLKRGVEDLAQQVDALDVIALDVCSDDSLAQAAATVRGHVKALDFVLHGVAFANRRDLEQPFVNIQRHSFAEALDVSAYSLVALAQKFAPLLCRGTHPSLLTLSYLGAVRAMPHYNVMGVAKAALEACVRYLALDLGPSGIRVNAISAGPVRTLSAAAIPGLRAMLRHVQASAPLGRNVLADDIADAALMALCHLGRGMTGEVMHVDGGYNIMGAPGAVKCDSDANAQQS